MSKLELSHIKHYLDHEVMAWDRGEIIKFMPYHLGMHLKQIQRGDDFKLILHPLSDLTKPIIVPGYNEGKEFVPIIELAKMVSWIEKEDYDKLYTSSDGGMYIVYFNASSPIDDIALAIEEYDINSSEYWIIKLLYQWHFAIDIPEGTWIDINTLDNA